MLKFLHFGDLHLNQLRHGPLVGGIHQRILDVYCNLKLVVDTAIDHTVDFVLFAGDAYQGHTPANHYREMFRQQIWRLADANIKVFMVPGNHDMSKSTIADHALGEWRHHKGIYLFDEPSTLVFDEYTITGIPWLYTPLDFNPELLTDRWNFCLTHCTVPDVLLDDTRTLAIGETNDLVIPLAWLEQFDYAALAHIHKQQHWGNVVYPGSCEVLTWGEHNDGSQHSMVLWVDGEWEYIPYPTRPRVDLEINVDRPYTLPTKIDPQTMYRVKLFSEDPNTHWPDITPHFRGAFSLKIEQYKPLPQRIRPFVVEDNMTDTDLIKQYCAMRGINFEDLQDTWQDVKNSI